nr:hypothetical protein [Candidatus Sigynarchaeota archaeon]
MGVYYFAGLGLSSGAVTVPVVYHVERLVRSLHLGMFDPFFAGSGEMSGQDLKGNIEGFVVITTPEILDGTIRVGTGKGQIQIPIWNEVWKKNTRKKWKEGDNIVDIVKSVCLACCKQLQDATGVPKDVYIYAVLLDLGSNFWDSFYKISQVFAFLKGTGKMGKETWINLTGGDNRVQHAMLIASAFQQSHSRAFYYFVERGYEHYLAPVGSFQKNDLSNPVPDGWTDLPIIAEGMNERHATIFMSMDHPMSISELKQYYRQENENENIDMIMTRFRHQGFVSLVSGKKGDLYQLSPMGKQMKALLEKQDEWHKKRDGGLAALVKDPDASSWFKLVFSGKPGD